MGNSYALKGKVIEGKLPEKYYKEKIWPELEDLLAKLNINEQRGLVIFEAFLIMDTDESNTVDIGECFKYFDRSGLSRTRFTERIFYTEYQETGSKLKVLGFRDFLISIWNYCSLTYAGLARMVFEVLDVDRTGTLDRTDIETIYRMMYDCDDHDEYYVSRLPFERDKGAGVRGSDIEYITKKDFIAFTANRDRHLIQPAIDFQSKMCRRLGGSLLWGDVMRFRGRQFKVLDDQCPTLEESLEAIVKSENPNSKQKAADVRLREDKDRLRAEQERVQEELQLQQQKRQEEEEAKLQGPQRDVLLAQQAFEAACEHFRERSFTVQGEGAWRRREEREALYSQYDRWVEMSGAYWMVRERELLDMCLSGGAVEEEGKIVEGKETEESDLASVQSSADRDLRTKDLLASERGALLVRALQLKHVLTKVQDVLVEKRKKRGKAYLPSDKEIAVETALFNVGEVMKGMRDEDEDLFTLLIQSEAQLDETILHRLGIAHRIDPDLEISLNRPGTAPSRPGTAGPSKPVKRKLGNLKEEGLMAQKMASHTELEESLAWATKELEKMDEFRISRTAHALLEMHREKRKKEFILKEFEVITNFGSRETRWELLRDEENNNRMVYLNVDTLDVISARSAICEKCDQVIDETEPRCLSCGAPRSNKNLKLLKSLGRKANNYKY